MAVRNDFSSGEVLTAADLNDTFASKLPYSYGTATPSTTTDGFLWYDENDTPPTPKFWDGAAFQALTSGKILQVVRVTNGSRLGTTNTSSTDTGVSITITPTKSTSAVLIVAVLDLDSGSTSDRGNVEITDSSNNPLSGATRITLKSAAVSATITGFGYSTPATTSATTYKLRFYSVSSGEVVLRGNSNPTQMYALEIGA